ncbi:MAG: hypothetical protein A3I66_21590 [Burkholderiales bacterium RIFCSPLOWO2_02_FULL_57_36]|nr:MAG: hypothetical protein A3I66_21590 [Burkholderiales bacterium RIFCSPLOWO2_02_FULL_57_36]
MRARIDESATVPATGLIAGLAGLARNGFSLLLSRLELAALELSEVLDHLLKLALVFALAIVTAWFAIAYGTALIVYLSWESLGWKILLIMAFSFTAMTVGLLLYAMFMARHNNFSLSATRAELQADRDMLL